MVASLSMSAEERQAIDAFRKDVVEASVDALILVRFTAEWCGPCKQLAPVIDKAIAEAGQGRTRQVVVDVDHNRLIAEQFRIQSVPTVYAFLGGQPVDGFVGVRSDREIRAMIEKLLASLPPTAAEADLDTLVAEAHALLDADKAADAADAFVAIRKQAPDRVDAIAGHARSLLALGQLETAAGALAAIPADSTDPSVQQARAAVELARTAGAGGETAELRARIAADPQDHEARIALANALFASGDRDGAAGQLLESIRIDRAWEEEAARTQLLKIIDAVGLADPWSAGIRRRLSSILFG
ncbi:MAG: tetratricopeptide repeat protein [Sphingomonadaceae bacterium]